MSHSATATARGRPREFDTDEVLDRVLQLFWVEGFESTSIADIVAATGLNKSSLYNAFGSKEALFERALERYITQRLTILADALTRGTGGLDDIETFFEMIQEEILSESGSRGCLAVNASTELGYRDEQAQEAGRRYRSQIRSALAAALARAEQRGEIAPGTAGVYADVLLPWMLGMSVVARGGADREELAAALTAGRALVRSWRIA
jgi:TetR/AcrR family transcriptional repressor of nem operon